ncbi:MAG: hypothetical protein Tsb0021_08440 [Chlamydiales bacterium]
MKNFLKRWVTLTVLSLLTLIIIPLPAQEVNPPNDPDARLRRMIGEENPAEGQIQRERAKVYRSRAEDELLYYKEIEPEPIEEGADFYLRDHPIPQRGIPSNPIPSNPIPNNPIPSNPLPSNRLPPFNPIPRGNQ